MPQQLRVADGGQGGPASGRVHAAVLQALEQLRAQRSVASTDPPRTAMATSPAARASPYTTPCVLILPNNSKSLGYATQGK